MARRQHGGSRAGGRAPRSANRGGAASFLWPALVVLLAGLAFLPAASAEFVNFDDDRLFLQNPHYRGLGGQQLAWMFTTTYMGHYQPLTWLSAAIDYELSGMRPTSYHVGNIVLHAVNALLVYFVARRLIAAGAGLAPGAGAAGGAHHAALAAAAGVAALLFAVHPLRAESVAWASERRDVLSTCLLLSALLAHLRAVWQGEAALASRGWYRAAVALLALSLLAKAWGMTFVLVLCVLDVFPLRRLPGRPRAWLGRELRPIWLQKIPFLVLGLAAALGAGLAQGSALDTMRTLEEWGVVDRLAQALHGLAFYPWKTVVPFALSPCYELPMRLDPMELRFALSAAATIGGAVAIVLLRRKLPALAAAFAVYAITVAPVLGLVQSGPQLVACRYSYVSTIGLAVLAGGGLLRGWRAPLALGWRALGAVVLALVIGNLFLAAWRQAATWRTSETLWRHAIEAGPPCSIAHLNTGIVHLEESRRSSGPDAASWAAAAESEFERAVEIRPDQGNAWYLLANLRAKAGRRVEAAEAYRRAIPHITLKHHAWVNLGNLHLEEGRLDDAIAAFRAAVAHVESDRRMFSSRPHLALGLALRARGEEAAARAALEVAAAYEETRTAALRELEALRGSPEQPD